MRASTANLREASFPGFPMRYRVLAVVLAAGLLSGCTNTDWDNALSYVGVGDSQKASAAPQQTAPAQTAPAQTAAAPANAAPESDPWCAEVAKVAASTAAEQGFDAATQQRQAQIAFQQCVH